MPRNREISKTVAAPVLFGKKSCLVDENFLNEHIFQGQITGVPLYCGNGIDDIHPVNHLSEYRMAEIQPGRPAMLCVGVNILLRPIGLLHLGEELRIHRICLDDDCLLYTSSEKYMINFLFVTALAVVAIYDIKEKRIPNLCVLLIAVLAVIDRLISGRGSFASGIFDVLCVSTPLLMVAVITKGAFGGGDVKLMAAGGLFLGWRLILTAAVIAFMTAGSYIFVQMCVNRQENKRKTRKSEIAFGPFLCEGMIISLTAGEKLIQWYLGLSG